MPTRRKRRLSSPDNSGSSSSSDDSLSVSDVTCPVCLSLVVEPVTMPCSHEVCYACFSSTVLIANKECPMCRTRIASWARRAAREGTLINRKRWELIKRLFPGQVQRRLSGEESRAGTPQLSVGPRLLSAPGEIRQEWEEQRRRAEAEWKEEREREAQAGEALAQRLASEEERLLQEKRRQERRDQRLACLWGVFGDTPAVLAAAPLVGALLTPPEDDDNDSASSFLPPEERPPPPPRMLALPAPPTPPEGEEVEERGGHDLRSRTDPTLEGMQLTPVRGALVARLCSRSVQTALLQTREQEAQTSEPGDNRDGEEADEDADESMRDAQLEEDLRLARRIQRALNRRSDEVAERVYELRSRTAH